MTYALHFDMADELDEIASVLDNVRDHLRSVRDRLADTDVTVRLELTPSEAATLHHFIGTHVPAYHGALTRDGLLDIRKRLLHALKDSGVLA